MDKSKEMASSSILSWFVFYKGTMDQCAIDSKIRLTETERKKKVEASNVWRCMM